MKCRYGFKMVQFIDFVNYKPATYDKKKYAKVKNFIDGIFKNRGYDVVPNIEGYDRILNSSIKLYLALCNKDIIGFIALANTAHSKVVGKMILEQKIKPENVYNIYLLGVAKEWRRAGIAAKLINFSTKQFCSEKCLFEVYARETNTPALAFYKKTGFAEVSSHKAYYSDTKEKAIIFAKVVQVPKVT